MDDPRPEGSAQPPPDPGYNLEPETAPATQQSRRRMVWVWGAITAAFLVLTGIVLFGWVFSSSSDTSDEQRVEEQARNAAIGAILDEFDQKTNGAIGVDNTGETFNWDGSGKVNFTLHIGGCKGVTAYATTPQKPENASQVTLHVMIPGSNGNTADDLPLKSDDDLKRLEQLLPQSSLEQCVGGVLRPTSG